MFLIGGNFRPAFAALLILSTALAQSSNRDSGTPVTLSVLVTDKSSRPVTNLNRDDFVVHDEGKLQALTLFETKEIPVSFGLLIDNSGSMRTKLKEITALATSIVSSVKPDDRMFLARMASNETRVVVPPTSDKAALLKAVATLNEAKGYTGLVDAIHACSEYLARHEKLDLPNRRRAIIIISDGIDTVKTKTMEELLKRLHADNIQIFAIGILPAADLFSNPSMSVRHLSKSFLDKLSKETGGRSFYPESEGELHTFSALVGVYLHTQYVVGYTSTNKTEKDSLRKVGIKLTQKPNHKELTVTARLRYSTSIR